VRTRSRLVPIAVALVEASACAASPGSDEWPVRPVRVIVPFSAGTGLDLAARLYGPLLAERWQHPVVVDNPGGDGTAGVQAFVTANDAHTVLLAPIGLVTVNPLLHDRLPYDPEHDLVPISAAVRTSIGIAAASGASVRSLSELVALVRHHPGQYAWAAAPGLPELVFRAFLALEELQMKHVAYRDQTSAVHDLSAGRIHVMVATLATMNTPLETGAARLLAVTNTGRVETRPDVPTAREAGFPTLTVDGLFGFFGWRGMPPELRQRIAADVRQASEDPALASRLANVGLIVTAGTTDELAVAMAEQRKEVDEIASTLGLRRPGREGGR
jgi:tripartite-type tricarboxylate transporter receptor subunit TctC